MCRFGEKCNFALYSEGIFWYYIDVWNLKQFVVFLAI